jgi:hypothetical protein
MRGECAKACLRGPTEQSMQNETLVSAQVFFTHAVGGHILHGEHFARVVGVDAAHAQLPGQVLRDVLVLEHVLGVEVGDAGGGRRRAHVVHRMLLLQELKLLLLHKGGLLLMLLLLLLRGGGKRLSAEGGLRRLRREHHVRLLEPLREYVHLLLLLLLLGRVTQVGRLRRVQRGES